MQPDEGATAVEYALLASLIAAVIAGLVLTLGQEALTLFTSLNWPSGGTP